MEFITKKHCPAGLLAWHGCDDGVADVEAMVPARTSSPRPAGKVRLAAIEMVHGSAGRPSSAWRRPVVAGGGRKGFDLSPSSLSPLDRSATTSRLSVTPTCATLKRSLPEIGGDHFRSSAVPTQSHPRQTQDRMSAPACRSISSTRSSRAGDADPSMQLCIEAVDQAVAAPTVTRASTPTPSAGPTRMPRCR